MDRDYIYTKNLSAGYGNVSVVENMNIGVERGKITVIIGPNGAGKSTVLRTIIGQLKPVCGVAYIDGNSLSEMSAHDVSVKMSVVMTDRPGTELMSCREVVAMGRHPYTGRFGILSGKDKMKVEDTLRLVDGEDLADKDFMQVSDGQRQKIMLARALCQEPEVMVLDEPTSFLDIKHKLELLRILKNMAKEKNIAVLMSLHEIELAQKTADKIICIKENAVDRCGTPEEIFTGNYIEKLFDIKDGGYNEIMGCTQPGGIGGTPEVFVIAGNGTGIPYYRKLYRDGIPFATGILHENDVDYQVAKSLAAVVIKEKAFNEISDENFDTALRCMRECSKVICAVKEFGKINERNRELLNLL